MGGLEAARAARSDNDDAAERELLCSVYLCSIVQEYSSRYDTSTSSTDGDASHKKTSQRKLNRCTCCVLCTVFINQEEGDPLAGLQREPLGPESLCFKYPAVKKNNSSAALLPSREQRGARVFRPARATQSELFPVCIRYRSQHFIPPLVSTISTVQ